MSQFVPHCSPLVVSWLEGCTHITHFPLCFPPGNSTGAHYKWLWVFKNMAVDISEFSLLTQTTGSFTSHWLSISRASDFLTWTCLRLSQTICLSQLVLSTLIGSRISGSQPEVFHIAFNLIGSPGDGGSWVWDLLDAKWMLCPRWSFLLLGQTVDLSRSACLLQLTKVLQDLR